MNRKKLKPKKIRKTASKSSLEKSKQNDKEENTSENGEDGDSETPQLDPPPDSLFDDFVKQMFKNLPNRFENMTEFINKFANQIKSDTQTKSETRDSRVQTETISDNIQKKEGTARKVANAIFKLNITENELSIDIIDPKTNEIEINEVDLSDSERALFKLPEEYLVNETAPDGSSFFDSFRQGLVALFHTSVAVKYLRAICVHAVRTPPPWLAKAIICAHLSTPAGGDLGATPQEFMERTLHQDTCGEIGIHGRILCEYFDVVLYVLAAEGENDVKCSLVSADGVHSIDNVPFGRPNTIYIINRGYHNFEPLLVSPHRTHHTNKRNTDSSLSNEKDIPKPLTENCKSPEPKPSTSAVDNNAAEHNRTSLPETSQQAIQAQTSTSSIATQQTSLKLSKEFERVQLTIKSGNINELKIALAEHHRVLDLTQVEPLLMELSLRDAILTTDIHIVDMVYEHWSSIAETALINHIHYLKLLGKALAAARDSCRVSLDFLNQYKQFDVDVHCIIEFNIFKIELSRELFVFHTYNADPMNWEDKVKHILDIITTVIDIYDEFCNKNIRVTKDLIPDGMILQSLLKDHTTIYLRYLLYAMYETYYRKLDFCVASVILEHFHSLKLRLELPLNTYQETEKALYYFIYRVKEDWRHYLPENRNKNRQKLPSDNNSSQDIEIPFDPNRILNGPVIYLEWEKFKNSLKELQKKLEDSNVMSRIRAKKLELPADEVNTLTLLPSLRDEHSLHKVVKYLEVCERVIQRSPRNSTRCALVVQRVLQVTGEYFKSTNTVHLSSTTRALLHVFIPAPTLEHLQKLREDFSHLINRKDKKPNLIRRIYLEETNLDIFFDVAKDLEQLKIAVNEVIHLYKLILRKSLLREGIDLIADRDKELPPTLKQYKEDIQHRSFILTNEIINDLSQLGISKQLIREYALLIVNTTDLEQKISETESNCIKYIITKRQAFINCINNELDDIKSKVKVEERWKTIINLLQFIMEQVNYFHENSEIKSNYLMLQAIRMPDKDTDQNSIMTDGTIIVRKLLDLFEQEANTYSQNNNITLLMSQANTAQYNYNEIKKLRELMSKKLFITDKEKDYLESKVGHHRSDEPILEKVLKSQELSMKERKTLFGKIDMDNRCKSIIGNMTVGSKRSKSAPYCLAQRATLLKDVIANYDVLRLVEKYHQDECFRILTESILADICMIYADCRFPVDSLFYDNKRKQLAEFRLRNFFAHGHPLLEVIGQMLDPSDLPAALFRFALLVVEDEPALAEVARLHEQGVPAEEALKNWNGPQTQRLKDYFIESFYSKLE